MDPNPRRGINLCYRPRKGGVYDRLPRYTANSVDNTYASIPYN